MLSTRQCLDEIADFYQSGPNEKSADLLERVKDLFFLTVDQQSADDRSAFGDVMERMAIDVDTLTRTRFSERISKTEFAPIDLIRGLARDEICVARPVLQYSPCLREGDLVSISNDAEQDHLMATAHRAELTEPVTDIIMERGNLNVLKVVISNTGAKYSAASRHRLLKTPELQEELQQVMRARRDLAPSPFARLTRLTEAEFWQQISEIALMTNDEPDDIQPEIKAPAEPAEKVNLDEQVSKKLEKKPGKDPRMEPTHPASEKALVNAATSGKAVETVQFFAKITHLDEVMIEHCIFKAHVPALIVLCKAHSLSPSTFTTMLQLRENHTGTPINDTVGLLRRYEGMTPDTAQRIICFSDKRRNVDANEQASNAP